MLSTAGLTQLGDHLIFPFESDAGDWTATAGTLTNSTTHTEGAKSLSHSKTTPGSHAAWQRNFAFNFSDRVITLDLNINDIDLVDTIGARVILSHTNEDWLPSDWSAWAVAKASLANGWNALTFDLNDAADTVTGSGATLTGIQLVAFQLLDTGSGTLIALWDNFRVSA